MNKRDIWLKIQIQVLYDRENQKIYFLFLRDKLVLLYSDFSDCLFQNELHSFQNLWKLKEFQEGLFTIDGRIVEVLWIRSKLFLILFI